ncbi:hypothetical protein SAMN05421847_0826 [Halpernia humi]|uniref:Uncharacterized protein n=1 Tax=Halpernia humi TaxID=493375 RepID=A0A1H5UM55_9FLAO|nr:hypothetical protein [Halpernia humi]SEF75508.1 hypothetical protein SAMN05421847_0826 [Halpernia humi]
MKSKIPYFFMVSGVLLFAGNLWSANFETSKLNYFSTASSVLIVLLGFVELKKKKNEN